MSHSCKKLPHLRTTHSVADRGIGMHGVGNNFSSERGEGGGGVENPSV